MIKIIIQCDGPCGRYLASGVDKLSMNWERRRYFDVEDWTYADVYTNLEDVTNAIEDGGYKGGLCPACQKEN